MIRQIPATEPNKYQIEQSNRKFGMFIHFGVNTFGNVEWSDGSIPALSYKPEKIDADGWVRTAYEAGMNYVIMITKHHDGFCLWNTEYTDYCVKNSGNKTDVVGEVAKACKKYGIKLGLYYSLWDRSEKLYKSCDFYDYIKYMKNQLTELMDGRYGEIVELWLDGAWDKPRSEWRLEEIYDLVKTLQPSCQIGVNHTVGDDYNQTGMPSERYLPENYQENDPLRMYPSDFRLWDPYMCSKNDPKIYTYQNNSYYMNFELTICSREGFSWFYSNIYDDKPVLDVEETAEKCRIIFETKNVAVINMPPNIKGELVKKDVEHLFEISEKLGIKRNIND